jgi:hypothetical protein
MLGCGRARPWSRSQCAGRRLREVASRSKTPPRSRRPFADWKKRGLNILQEPVQMDFGTTFVATDPDGHRLRVFVPAAA